ncbi:uncharacterized protein LOC143146406 [Ptiloglossa arizonensis]|uniref:uncharacterized protein LOC143146406 n=1 Tax=Ptiloglossa arizonensis TaxID=3350558 RepID=UPI003FA0C8AE
MLPVRGKSVRAAKEKNVGDWPRYSHIHARDSRGAIGFVSARSENATLRSTFGWTREVPHGIEQSLSLHPYSGDLESGMEHSSSIRLYSGDLGQVPLDGTEYLPNL